MAAFTAGPRVNFPDSLSCLYIISTLFTESPLQSLNFYPLAHMNFKDSGSKSNFVTMILSFILQSSLAPPPNTTPMEYLIQFSINILPSLLFPYFFFYYL